MHTFYFWRKFTIFVIFIKIFIYLIIGIRHWYVSRIFQGFQGVFNNFLLTVNFLFKSLNIFFSKNFGNQHYTIFIFLFLFCQNFCSCYLFIFMKENLTCELLIIFYLDWSHFPPQHEKLFPLSNFTIQVENEKVLDK